MHIFAIAALFVALVLIVRDYYESWRLKKRRARTPATGPTLREEVEKFVEENHHEQYKAFVELKRRGVIHPSAEFNGHCPTPQLNTRQNPILSPGLERAKQHTARAREERRHEKRRRWGINTYLRSPMAETIAVEVGEEVETSVEEREEVAHASAWMLSPMAEVVSG